MQNNHLEALTGVGGMASICLRAGKANEKMLQKAAREAEKGVACPGFPAHFRKKVATWSMEFGEGVRACFVDAAALPISHEPDTVSNARSGTSKTDELGSMMWADMEDGGDSARLLESHAPALIEFVEALHARIAELLESVSTWRDGTPQDRAYHIFDIVLQAHTSLAHCARKVAGVPVESGVFGGLPIIIASDISRAVAALVLRTQAQNDALMAEAKAICNRTFEKAYTIPAEASALIKEATRAQRRMSHVVDDALTHRLLRENIEFFSTIDGSDDASGALPEGVSRFIEERPAGALEYSSWNRGALRVERLALLPNSGMGESTPLQEDEEVYPGVARQGNRLFINQGCRLAGISEPLLPPGTASLIHGVFNAQRSSLVRIFAGEPLLAEQVRHLHDPASFLKVEQGTMLVVTPEDVSVLEGCLQQFPMHPMAKEMATRGHFGLTPIELTEQNIQIPQLPLDDTGRRLQPSIRDVCQATLQKRMYTFADLERALHAIGLFAIDGRGKGSHTVFRNHNTGRICTISRRYASGPTTDVPLRIVIATFEDLKLSSEQLAEAIHSIDA